MPRIELVPMTDLDPEVRAALEAAVTRGDLASARVPRAFAYSSRQVRGIAAGLASGQASAGLLSPRLRELIRLRSAQLAGCAECRMARYDESVGDAAVECMLEGSGDALDDREHLVMRFVTLMHTDHERIDDDFYRELARQFTTAEIIELGITTGNLLGYHRFIHTLDILGDSPPVIRYDPAQVDAASGASVPR